MFWGVGIESRIGFSPFKYCNGTARASLLSQHSYDYLNTVPTYPDIFFVDFAGSGVVHLLGIRSYKITIPICKAPIYILLLTYSLNTNLHTLLTCNNCNYYLSMAMPNK